MGHLIFYLATLPRLFEPRMLYSAQLPSSKPARTQETWSPRALPEDKRRRQTASPEAGDRTPGAVEP